MLSRLGVGFCRSNSQDRHRGRGKRNDQRRGCSISLLRVNIAFLSLVPITSGPQVRPSCLQAMSRVWDMSQSGHTLPRRSLSIGSSKLSGVRHDLRQRSLGQAGKKAERTQHMKFCSGAPSSCHKGIASLDATNPLGSCWVEE